MNLRTWLWLGTVLNAIIFLPAAVMAFNAIGFAFTYSQGPLVGPWRFSSRCCRSSAWWRRSRPGGSTASTHAISTPPS